MNQSVTNDYAQVGTRKDPSTNMVFSTSGISGTITKIEVDCASYNGVASLSATVGGNAFGAQDQSTASWSNNTGGTVTFSGSASGAIVITMTNGSNGRAMYIKSITVTYSSGGSTPTPADPTFEWSATSATATVGQTFDGPTLTNTSNGVVTYNSSDETVATISETGEVSILAAGTTTITASVAATSSFNSASASYTLTVNAGSTPSGDTYTGDWVASEQGFTSGAQVTSPSAIDTNVSVSFTSNGNGSKYYDNGSAVRVYGGNSFTIAGVEGVTITDISITFGTNDGSNPITTNTGTYESGSWTGSGASVTFSVASGTGNRRIAAISVTYTKEGGSDLLAADLKFQGSTSYNHTMEVGDVWDAGFTQATNATVTFTFSSTGVATYNASTGKVTAVAEGTTTLTAEAPANSTYDAGTAILNITVSKKPHGLAYAPTSFTITVGDAFETPQLTNPNHLTVTYSGNNDNLASVNTSTGDLTFVSGATGDITVTATWEGDATYEAGTASYTLHVLPEASGSTTFTKVTSTNDLEVGEEYMIVFEGDNDKPAQALAAISTTSTKYGTAYDVTITSNTITITNQPVAILTLGQNGNNYTFKSSLNNEYLYWGSGNTLNTNATVSNNTSWTITVDDGAVSILNVENSARKLQYNYNNGSNQRFACYETTQTAIALYKKGSSTPTAPYVRFAEDEKTVEFEASATVKPQTAETNTASVTYTSSDNAVAEVNSTTGEVTMHAKGDVTITATSTEDATLTASYMLHVIQPNIELFVKVDNESELVDGGEYLLVQYVMDGTTSAYAYDGKASGNYASYVAVTITDNKVIDNATPKANVITLSDAGNGKWYIQDMTTNNYLYYTGGNNLYFNSTNAETDAYKWSISVTPMLTQIENVNVAGRMILFNSTSGQERFACYSSNQNQVVLYKKATALEDANLSYATASYNVTLGNHFNAQTLTNPNSVTPVKFYSNNPTSVVVDETTGAVTVIRSGSAKVIATFYGNSQFHKSQATYTINVTKVANEGLLFNETFDKLKGTGGNDGQFLGQLGVQYTRTNGWNGKRPTNGSEWDSSWETDMNWTLFDTTDEPSDINDGAYVQAASQCVKFGAGSVSYQSKADGELVTSAISFGDATEGTLTFSAAGFGTDWNSQTVSGQSAIMNPNTLTVTATNCTLTFKNKTGNSTISGNTITLENGVWNDFTYMISEVTGDVVITFKGYRGFLDDIAVGGPYSVTIGTTGYSTLFYSAAPLTVPSEVKVYTLHKKTVNGYTDVEMEELHKADGSETLNIAEGMGVILYSETAKDNKAITYNFPFYFATDAVKDDNNILEGSDEKKLFNDPGYEYFVLGKKDEVGFYHMTNTNGGKWVTNGAHKAFFRLPEGESILNDTTSSAAMRGGFSLEDMIATAIEHHEQEVKKDNVYYNLAGQRVMSPTKGIYIVNGKKVFIK